MYSKYVTGTICDTVFEQVQNLPTNKDGVALFKLLTFFTVVASLQLLILSFNQIISLLPSTVDYVFFAINANLTHISLLARTPTRVLKDAEKIQHTLTMYGCIKHPATWNTWVLTKNNDFEEGTITIYQNFMNQAFIKYKKISTAQ